MLNSVLPLVTTTAPPPPPPPTGPFGVLFPSGHGIDCHTDVDYTNLSSCYSDGFNGFDKSKTYSKSNNICHGTGEVDGRSTRIGDYCTLAALPDCSVVWGIFDSYDNASRRLFWAAAVRFPAERTAKVWEWPCRRHLDYLVRSQQRSGWLGQQLLSSPSGGRRTRVERTKGSLCHEGELVDRPVDIVHPRHTGSRNMSRYCE
jgi:hypothetical protein